MHTTAHAKTVMVFMLETTNLWINNSKYALLSF